MTFCRRISKDSCPNAGLQHAARLLQPIPQRGFLLLAPDFSKSQVERARPPPFAARDVSTRRGSTQVNSRPSAFRNGLSFFHPPAEVPPPRCSENRSHRCRASRPAGERKRGALQFECLKQCAVLQRGRGRSARKVPSPSSVCDGKPRLRLADFSNSRPEATNSGNPLFPFRGLQRTHHGVAPHNGKSIMPSASRFTASSVGRFKNLKWRRQLLANVWSLRHEQPWMMLSHSNDDFDGRWLAFGLEIDRTPNARGQEIQSPGFRSATPPSFAAQEVPCRRNSSSLYRRCRALAACVRHLAALPLCRGVCHQGRKL